MKKRARPISEETDHLVATLGIVVRKRRQELGWSIAKLSKEAGVDRSWLTEVSTGRGVPTLETCVKLANAVGISLAWEFNDAP